MNLYNFAIPKNGEEFTTLLEHKNIKINRIVSSADVEPVEYVQEEDEWVVIIEGEATLFLEDEEKILKKGDTLFIPAKTSHKVLKIKDGTI
jgi:cupin 2 domain-containing protein